MLYNYQRKKLYRRLLVGGAMCVAGLGVFSCSDKYDLDSEQPSGLNSIYGYLDEQGNYTIAMRLIDDLGQTEVLSQTGSKTMFIADDDAFRAFFASNPWGVKSYEGLSYAQKKLLLNSAMIDNPFTTSMLSTATGPVKGEVCRRASSVTLYDSVLNVLTKSDLADEVLPANARFDEVRSNRDTLVLFADNSTAAPMLAFTAKFLSSNKVASTDIDFVYNQPAGTRSADDVYINNSKVTDANIFCKNGFVHKVDRVILPLDNMAEVIRKKPQTSIYNSIVERFAAPEYSRSNTDAYNASNGTDIDSIFVKRYFSDRTYGSTSTSSVGYTVDKNGIPMEGGASLKFDPGWNGYIPYVANDRDGMQEDLGVMIVPTDAAMQEWWNNGGGAVIKNFYGTLDATPNSVLDDLVRVNQLVSFIQSVPSRFGDILNDANEPIGITEADVDSVFLACNGVIYLTNKVFAPTSYSSVLFPAVVDTTNFMSVENAINNLQYNAYLNSMVAEYTLLLPTNKGLLTYIDPVSYGRTDGSTDVQLWEINLDPSKTAQQGMTVDVYNATVSPDGVVEKNGSRLTQLTGGTGAYNANGSFSTGNAYIKDRFDDLLDNIIVTEKYQPGKKYYQTKGRTFVRIDGNTEGSNIYGSMQQENGTPIAVSQAYNMENGATLVLDGVPMSTRNSVAMLLNQHPETFSEFYQLLEDANAIYKMYTASSSFTAGDQTYGNLFNLKEGGSIGAEKVETGSVKATYLLNNFHYTIYAPTNDAMQEAYRLGLPTHEDLNNAQAWDEWFGTLTEEEKAAEIASSGCCPGDSAARIQEVMLDFVKYHIQDNSLFLDQGFNTGEYYSGKTALIKSTQADEETGTVYETGKYTPGRPYKIHVESVSSTGMTIRDNVGNERHVITDGGLYNMMAREYWYNGTTNARPYQTQLDNSSFVVVHAIDGPLIYADGKHNDETQFKYKYRELTTE